MPEARSLPKRRILVLLLGLLVMGGLGYWLTSRHPVPTGPMAEQLRNRTWRFPGVGMTDLRLNADGTLRFGGVQDGTWSVTGNRLDLSFELMPNLPWKNRIDALIHGKAKRHSASLNSLPTPS